MRPFFPHASLLALTLGLTACQSPDTAPPVQTSAAAPSTVVSKRIPVVPSADGHTTAAITAQDFAARLRAVSSDEFEGRKPATQGERLTTAWIRNQFEQMGVKPGIRGEWFQTVPMVEATLLDAEKIGLDVKTIGGDEHLVYGRDMVVVAPDARSAVSIADSDIVFAGYGVDAPDQHWNDYAGIDVKGKTVVVLFNDPGWGNHDDTLFKGRELTYYGRWTYKFEEAARKGAVACLIVHDTADAGYPWNVVVNSVAGPQYSLPASEEPDRRLPLGGWITAEAAERVFAKAGKDFKALRTSADVRGFKPVDLGARASIHFASSIAHTGSQNVIGLVPGGTRPDEVVIYSAHWDHFGRDAKLAGDQIYNGAWDNGTGIAALLEIAEAFAHQDPPPQRSVLFIADTLEESNLLGIRYYVTHPAFPIGKTVASINMDTLPIVGRTHDITVIGWGQSEVDELIAGVAKTQGRIAVPDDAPEKGFLFRSDQLQFARVGVPGLYARSGPDLLVGGEEAGRKLYADYTTNRYHKPADNYDPDWDFSGVIEDVQAFYAVGRKLADDTSFPQWKPGADFHRAAPSTTE